MDQQCERMVTDDVFLGVQRHELIGEKFLLEQRVPDSVTCFSRGHVDAKRYLTFKKQDYYNSE